MACKHEAAGPLLPAGSELLADVGGRAPVQVLPDGVVVHGRSKGHKDVPDGMGEGNDAVTLEEHHPQAVDEAPPGQLLKPIRVILRGERGKGRMLSAYQPLSTLSSLLPPGVACKQVTKDTVRMQPRVHAHPHDKVTRHPMPPEDIKALQEV